MKLECRLNSSISHCPNVNINARNIIVNLINKILSIGFNWNYNSELQSQYFWILYHFERNRCKHNFVIQFNWHQVIRICANTQIHNEQIQGRLCQYFSAYVVIFPCYYWQFYFLRWFSLCMMMTIYSNCH